MFLPVPDCNCHTWSCLTVLIQPDPKCRRTSADKETSGCHSWIHQAPVHPKAVCAMKCFICDRNRVGTNRHRLYQQGIYELIIVFSFLQQGSNLSLQRLHFSTQHLVPGFGGIKFFSQLLVVFLESIVLPSEFLQWGKRKWELEVITKPQVLWWTKRVTHYLLESKKWDWNTVLFLRKQKL